MSYCAACGNKVDECNESIVVCPHCGDPDCWGGEPEDPGLLIPELFEFEPENEGEEEAMGE
jgi:hypothetical protein